MCKRHTFKEFLGAEACNLEGIRLSSWSVVRGHVCLRVERGKWLGLWKSQPATLEKGGKGRLSANMDKYPRVGKLGEVCMLKMAVGRS